MSSEPEIAVDDKSPARSRRRLFPSIGVWIWLALLVGLNVLARLPDTLDSGLANVAGLVSGFLGVMTLLVWLAVFSGYSTAVRRAPLAIVLCTIALLTAACRIESVSGNLGVWRLRWRWAPYDDELLAAKGAAAVPQTVPLNVTTDNDFPQFLGPQRSGAVDRVVLARDWTTPPRRLWKQQIGAGHSSFSVVNGYAVTLEQRSENELLTCYDLKTGDLKWSDAIVARHRTVLGGTGPRSTPTIFEGKVYAIGAMGNFRCVDGATGHRLWEKDLRKECGTTDDEEASVVAWGRAGSPLIVDHLVIVPGGGPASGKRISLLAFDKDSGERVWQGGSDQIGYASPSVVRLAGMRQILIVNETTISSHDPASGAVLWTQPWPGTSHSSANASQAVAVGDDKVLVSKGYTGGAELFRVSRDAAGTWSPKTIWQSTKVLQTKFSNVAIQNGFVYGLSDGILECVELDTGKRRWKQGRYGHGQILKVSDLLLVVGESGEVTLVELSPDGHHPLGSFQAIEGQTWNNPSLYGRYLLVRNSEEAACYELPLSKR